MLPSKTPLLFLSVKVKRDFCLVQVQAVYSTLSEIYGQGPNGSNMRRPICPIAVVCVGDRSRSIGHKKSMHAREKSRENYEPLAGDTGWIGGYWVDEWRSTEQNESKRRTGTAQTYVFFFSSFSLKHTSTAIHISFFPLIHFHSTLIHTSLPSPLHSFQKNPPTSYARQHWGRHKP